MSADEPRGEAREIYGPTATELEPSQGSGWEAGAPGEPSIGTSGESPGSVPDVPDKQSATAMATLMAVGTPAGKKTSATKVHDKAAGDEQGDDSTGGDAGAGGDMTLGDGVIGKVKMAQEGDVVTIEGSFQNLAPGKHGFYIRADSVCTSARDARHFNPTGAKHGPPWSFERHAGDLGNLVVNQDGTASFEMKTDSFTVTEGHSSIVGKTIVVTRGEDNGKAKASRRAGPAVACGTLVLEGETRPVVAR